MECIFYMNNYGVFLEIQKERGKTPKPLCGVTFSLFTCEMAIQIPDIPQSIDFEAGLISFAITALPLSKLLNLC